MDDLAKNEHFLFEISYQLLTCLSNMTKSNNIKK